MKNSIRTAIALLTLTGAAALAPTSAAGADPSVDAYSDGNSVIQAGAISLGQAIDVTGSACTSLTPGETTYFGMYASLVGDPWINATQAEKALETVTENGSVTWPIVVDPASPTGVAHMRWYCSTAPATSLTDSSMLWVGPEVLLTIDAGSAAPAAATSLRTANSFATTSASTGGGTFSMDVDPNALPKVDLMGINGPKAAAIKTKVDARVKTTNRIDNLLRRRSHRPAKATSNADYVKAAFKTVGGKAPSAKVMKSYVDRLDAGQLRVAVVEDIALTQHDAAWWNKR